MQDFPPLSCVFVCLTGLQQMMHMGDNDAEDVELGLALEQLSGPDGDGGIAALESLALQLRALVKDKAPPASAAAPLEQLHGLVATSAVVRAALVYPSDAQLEGATVSVRYRPAGAPLLKPKLLSATENTAAGDPPNTATARWAPHPAAACEADVAVQAQPSVCGATGIFFLFLLGD